MLTASILIREDRLPLPFVCVVYAGGTYGTAQLVHLRPDGRTIADEDFTARIVDAGLHYGSIGVLNGRDDGSALRLAFLFPGSEGDRTYVYPPSSGWANRSHPLRLGATHAYAVEFKVGAPVASFAEAAKRSWRGKPIIYNIYVCPTVLV